MKIIYICNGLKNAGGIERIITTKANYLSKDKGKKIYIISTNSNNGESFYKLNEEIKHIDLKVESRGIRGILEYMKKLKQELKNINPNVLIGVTGKESFLLPLIDQKIYKIREIHFCKASRNIQNKKKFQINRILNIFYDFLEELIIKKYDQLIVLTKEDFENWNHKNKKVIYNFKTILSSKVSNLENKVAIAVGRLDYQKGFDDLIKSWKLVNENNIEWKLNIYGEGPLKKDLENLIKELKLENSVFLKGKTNNINIKYLNSSLYILSSRHEGLPLVLIEAAEHGLPLISFDCPCGPKEIIQDGINGYLIKNRNIKELAHRIIEIISNESERKIMGQNSKKISQKFNERKIMEKWERVLDSI